LVRVFQISGDIELNGGKLTAEQDTAFTGNISVSANSTIQIDSSKALTYGGQAVDIGSSKLEIQGGGSFLNTETTPIKLNDEDSGLVLDNVIVSNVSATAESSSQGVLGTSNDSTVNNLSLTDKLRLSVDSDKTLTVTNPLTVPSQGIALSGAGTLKLSDNLTLNGNASLASGSLTVDTKGLLVNFGGDLNLSGGVLLTDEDTNFHLLNNSTLTTNAEQEIGDITIPQGEQPMLTLSGNDTKLKVVKPLTLDVPCPQSLPVEPKAQLRLPGGVRISSGGELCIDGWA
jgi:hypothetical protein